MVKKRNTVERFVSNLIPTDENRRKAEIKDKKIDKRIGTQIKSASDKTPATDWRRIPSTPPRVRPTPLRSDPDHDPSR